MTDVPTLFNSEQVLDTTEAKRHAVYSAYRPSGIDWVGEIPDHWHAKRLKYLATFRSGFTPNTENLDYWDGDIPWVSPKDMKRRLLVETQDNVTQLAVEDVFGSLVEAGSVLVVVRSGILRHSLPVAIASRDLAINQDIRALRPLGEIEADYLAWLIEGNQRQLLDAWVKPGTTVESVESDYMLNEQIPLPPVNEQQAIAAFLDERTRRIDELIEAKRKLLDLLAEKRQAVITHAVTKGLDPNAKLKPCGIDWLGDVPAHWAIEQLRRGVDRFVDYRGRTPTKTESGVPLITAAAVRDGEIRHERAPEYMAEDEYTDWMSRGWPEVDDVVITSEAPLGEVALVKDVDVAFAQRIILFKVNRALVHPEYLRYYYLSEAGQAELLSRASGSTATGIRADRLRASAIIVPPVDEQERIVEYLDKECGKLVEPIRHINKAIELARELRSSLVSAAVTGKIDVRGEG